MLYVVAAEAHGPAMPPLVYLVRHAHASDAQDDAVRPISARGKQEIKQLAAILRPSGAFRPADVWHSPLVRARETAELLCADLGVKADSHEHGGLIPEADPTIIARALAEIRRPIALFGHEPHMSALATLLVTREPAPIVFAFQKATMLALESAGGHFWVRWQISPDLFG